jgi:hypothetical protein
MITVVHGPEWRRLRFQLRKEEKTLDERLLRAQRLIVDQMAHEAQAKILVAQVQGGPTRHTGMRRRIAQSVKTKHRGMESQVETRMRNHDERNLPLGMDRASGWAHPLFGDRSHWYRERPVKPGWFTNTFDAADERVPDRLFEVLQDSVERLAEAG